MKERRRKRGSTCSTKSAVAAGLTNKNGNQKVGVVTTPPPNLAVSEYLSNYISQ